MADHRKPCLSLDRREFLFFLLAAGVVLPRRTSPLRGAPAPETDLFPPRVKAGEWALFGYDIYGTRFNRHEKIIGPDTVERLKVKWTFDQAKGFSQTTPMVVRDSLYFAAHDGYVYALDAQSGAGKWKFHAWEGIEPDTVPPQRLDINADPVGEMRGSAAYADGRLFIGDGTARLHCLDAETGKELWKTAMDPQAGLNRSKISSSPIVYDGKVFIGTSTTAGRAQVACLDAGTGAVRWRFDTVPDPKAAGGGAVWTAAAIDPEYGIVYNATGSVHGHVPGPVLFSESMIANDLESGELLWFDQLRSNDPFDLDYSCHPILFECEHPTRAGAVRRCVGAGSKTGFHVFDRYTGERFWSAAATNGGPTLNSTAYGYNKIFMVSNSAAEHRPGLSATVALHAYTGEILWWTPNPSNIQGAVAVANGLFYQGLMDGTLQAFEVETGKPIWTYKLPAPRRGGITISNGTLYTSCGVAKLPPYTLYAFSIDGK